MARFNGIYEFGPFRLDAGARRLYRDSAPVTLTPKCFDLLLVLVERRGQALSKAELLEAVWPDVEVEEGNLTFQMAVLRKALGVEAAGWIETVSRFGYLFSAPVTERRAVDLPADPASTPAARPKPWRRFAAAAAVVAVVLFVGFLLSARVRSTASPLVVRPLTSLPGSETAPSISFDGKDVAFVWSGSDRRNGDIYVKSEGVEDPLRFTSTPEAECCPKWSPDGRHIAFARRLTANLFDIIVKPYPDGPERAITQVRDCFELNASSGRVLDWHPDGDHLVVAGIQPGENCGLSFVSTGTGRIQPLTVPPQPTERDTAPAVSPNGRRIAFTRGTAWPSYLVYTLDISSELKPLGSPRPLTSGGKAEMWPVWLPGSDEILFTSGSSPTNSTLFRAAVAGTGRAQQVQGVDAIAFLASISPGGRLVYATRPVGGSSLRRIELRPDPALSPVETEFAASTYSQQVPAYSPDGKLVAFESERAGVLEIFLAAPDGTQLRRLTHFNGPAAQMPRWSPDGTRLSCSVSFRGQRDIFVVDVAHGTATRLTNTPHDEGATAWSPDGNWIYYGSNGSGSYQVWKIPAAGGDGIQVTRSGGNWPFESPDGKFVYYRKFGAPPSIWRIPAEGGTEEAIVERVHRTGGFVVVEDGIYYVSPDQSGRSPSPAFTLRFKHLPSGRDQDLATLTGPVGWGFTVSPDRRNVIHARGLPEQFDLKVVDNFR